MAKKHVLFTNISYTDADGNWARAAQGDEVELTAEEDKRLTELGAVGSSKDAEKAVARAEMTAEELAQAEAEDAAAAEKSSSKG